MQPDHGSMLHYLLRVLAYILRKNILTRSPIFATIGTGESDAAKRAFVRV